MKFIKVLVAVLFIMSVLGVNVNSAKAATSPDLGTADSFAILSGAAITDAGGASTITAGDVGASPITGAAIGLTSLQVAGTIYSVDAFGPLNSVVNPGLLTTAKNDLGTAYDGLAAIDNAPCTTDYGVGPQNLTLVSPLGPGVYCVGAGGFGLTGNLTLAGSGVWIFRSAATIITSPGSSVTGGNPCNVWWRAATSATLDTTTSFIGNILALASITMNNGATLNGRALARNAAITLDTNTITKPTCAIPAVNSSSGSSGPKIATTLTEATQGSPYSTMIEATGGIKPYTWSIYSGSLPNGLTLNSQTGEISGTPTVSGNFDFVILVIDSSPKTLKTYQTLTLEIVVGPSNNTSTDTISTLPQTGANL